ncbi:hypothetical protein [Thermus altitudinis]|nr:hypothetical protein [Thermus altitudinis]
MRARLRLTGSQVSPVARRPLEELAQGCCPSPEQRAHLERPPGDLLEA